MPPLGGKDSIYGNDFLSAGVHRVVLDRYALCRIDGRSALSDTRGRVRGAKTDRYTCMVLVVGGAADLGGYRRGCSKNVDSHPRSLVAVQAVAGFNAFEGSLPEANRRKDANDRFGVLSLMAACRALRQEWVRKLLDRLEVLDGQK